MHASVTSTPVALGLRLSLALLKGTVAVDGGAIRQCLPGRSHLADPTWSSNDDDVRPFVHLLICCGVQWLRGRHWVALPGNCSRARALERLHDATSRIALNRSQGVRGASPGPRAWAARYGHPDNADALREGCAGYPVRDTVNHIANFVGKVSYLARGRRRQQPHRRNLLGNLCPRR